MAVDVIIIEKKLEYLIEPIRRLDISWCSTNSASIGGGPVLPALSIGLEHCNAHIS